MKERFVRDCQSTISDRKIRIEVPADNDDIGDTFIKIYNIKEAEHANLCISNKDAVEFAHVILDRFEPKAVLSEEEPKGDWLITENSVADGVEIVSTPYGIPESKALRQTAEFSQNLRAYSLWKRVARVTSIHSTKIERY